MKTEVEIRGPLTSYQYHDLLKLLKKEGHLLKESNQLAIFFKVKKNNFSLKQDHELEKMVLKFGGWQKGSRKEIEVILQKGQFKNALELLKGLGYNQGHKVPAFRRDFIYKGVWVSLKTKAVIGPHYEMETTVGSRSKIKLAKEKLLKISQELNLKVWSEAEYRNHTHRRWQAHHPGPQKL